MRDAAPAPRRWARSRAESVALLEIWALCGLAIAQPVLDATGRAPDFFLFHGAGAVEIMAMVAIVVGAPPLALWALAALTGLAGPRVRRYAQVGLVGALTAALAIQAGKALLPLRGALLVAATVAVGAAVAAAYARWSAVSRLLRLAAVGPLVFVLLFVFASPTAPLLVGGGRAASGAGRSVGAHPPIVMIIFDEFAQTSLLDDRGALDARRFPHFARLAAGATWYRNATTVSHLTAYAVPSMLTGRYPLRKAAPHYTQYPDNLFTLLGGAYRVRAQESILHLCPPDVCASPQERRVALPELLDGGVTVLGDLLAPRDSRRDPSADFDEPTAAQAEAAQRAPVAAPQATDERFGWAQLKKNQPARFEKFLSTLRPADRPTLHFLHLLIPHRPLRYLGSGARYHPWPTVPRQEPWRSQLHRQRHLAQVEYADRLLGVTLDALRARGLYDDALLVVTADHGVAYTPGTNLRRLSPGGGNGPELGWVPLFIKTPGQTAGRVDFRNWLQVDLLPTVADHAGVQVPWRTDGIAATRQLRESAEKPFFVDPGDRGALDAARGLAAVRGGPDLVPGLPPAPLPSLVGRRVADLRVTGGGPRATVPGLDRFRAVDPVHGVVPAVVSGDLPPEVPAGANLAIAVNGVVAAVVPVLRPERGQPRFAGLVADGGLFRPGANRLELFLVGGDGPHLRRLRL
jgi:hypothetical protein